MAMKGDQQVVLPSLQPKVNYHSFPRRYEETKPAVVQEFTHRRIIDLGHMIEEQAQARCSVEKAEAVQHTETRIWQLAEREKQEAVDKTAAKLRKDHEKVVKKLSKAHERTLQEEKDRVKNDVEAQAEEKLKQTIAEWTIKLEEAIQETKNQCHQELLQAVAKARKEEQDAAAQLRLKLTKAFEAQMIQRVAEAEEEKKQALAQLSTEKDEEQKKALEQAQNTHDETTAKKIAELRAFYHQNIRILQTHVHEKKEQIEKLEGQLMETITEKDRIRRELLETREEFELFIHRVIPFNRTYPKFVMPAPKTITLGITEEEWRKLWQ